MAVFGAILLFCAFLFFPLPEAAAACATIKLQFTMVENGPVGDTNYEFQITASGGAAPYNFTPFGTIPGVSFSVVSGNMAVFKGTPTQAGTYPIGINATDTNGCGGGSTYSITINPVIYLSPDRVGAGTIGLPYNQTIYVVGGTPPYSFNVGTFPGVNLVTNSDGNAAGYCTLSGIPTTVGNFSISASVADSSTNVTSRLYTNSVLPSPQLQITYTNGGVSLSWPGAPAAGPFILQSATGLSNPIWTNVITTFASPIQLPLAGTNAFFRLNLPILALDLTDYNQDRPAVAGYYFQNPQNYWGQFGLPSLARLGNLDASLGQDPANAFGGIYSFFDPVKFGNAFQGGQLPLDFSNVVYISLHSGQATNQAIANGFCSLVTNLDYNISITNELGTFRIYQEFETSYTSTYTTNAIDFAYGPITNKPYSYQPYTNNVNLINLHGSDYFATNLPVFFGNAGIGNTNTSTNTPWGQIATSPANTTYNAACAGVATGASLAKMDPVFPKSTTPQFWNQFSMQLGASSGGDIGAPLDTTDAYYQSLGYSSVQAYDGPFETALEEANKALARGCDVTLYYLSADGKSAHIEMVTQIDMDAGSSQRGTIHTLSWGQSATTSYDSGQWSGKSDAGRYGAGSWVTGKGKATFYYHCPE